MDPIWPTESKQKWPQPIGSIAIQQRVFHHLKSSFQCIEGSVADSWSPPNFIVEYDIQTL
jgi:hypothetical protein